MGSANYIIGKDLSLDGFNKYIMPLLSERGISVPDKMGIPYVAIVPWAGGTREESRTGVLTTLVGNDLSEQSIRKVLEIASKKADEDERVLRTKDKRPTAYEYQLIPKELRLIGDYSEESAGSKLFVSLALDFYLKRYEEAVDEIEEKISGLLEKKLSEFS